MRISDYIYRHMQKIKSFSQVISFGRTHLLLLSLLLAVLIFDIAHELDRWWADIFGTELDFLFNLLSRHTFSTAVLFGIFVWSEVMALRKSMETTASIFLFIPLICLLRLTYVWPGEWLTLIIQVSDEDRFRISLFAIVFIWSTVMAGFELYKICRIYSTNEEVRDAVNDESDTLKGTAVHAFPHRLVVKSVRFHDDGRKMFASNVADIVADTDLRMEPLSLGLTGEWGTGKSLVLEEIKDRLREKDITVIEFFPWQSTSPSNLIEDFFKTMSSALHATSRRLGGALEDYADKLIKLDIDKRLNSLAKIGRYIGGSYTSINEARTRIECWKELLKKKDGIPGNNLARLVEEFGYDHDEGMPPEMLEDLERRAQNKIDRMFGSMHNLITIIQKLYVNSIEDKERAIKALQ